MDQEQYMFRPIAEDGTVSIEASAEVSGGREAGIAVDVNQPAAASVLDHVSSIRQGYA